MTRIFIAAVALVFAAGGAQAKVSKDAVAGVQKAITEAGCTVEADDDITAKGEGYKADDVQCKDDQYDMLLDKGFKITSKED
jgi:type 1 fimbria pilin